MNNIQKIFKKISKTIIDHLMVVVLILSLTLITFVGIFLYKNFYITIISAKRIIVLQQEVSPASLKQELVNEIVKKNKEKQSIEPINWEKLKDIFILPANKGDDSTANAAVSQPIKTPESVQSSAQVVN